jgi:phage terminase Nu1 subunit (DNA packaging protein)
MALQTTRKLCTTREAAKIYGCSMCRIRQMARAGAVWHQRMGPRVLMFDADELARLSKTRAAARAAGTLRGTPPQGFRPK